MPSHVQLPKLVHMSGIHWHVCASFTSGFAFFFFYYIEYNNIVSLFQAQDNLKRVKAVVM